MAMFNDNKRAGLLDEIRGFAIICMVVYHVAFTAKEFYGVEIPILFDSWFDIIQKIFAGAFIFISGTVCRYSRNNLKRGAQCFLLGMVITFVVAFFSPDTPVVFGILHFLGISMILFGLGEKMQDVIPAFAGIILCAFLFVLTMNVSVSWEWVSEARQYSIRSGGFIGIGSLSLALPRAAYDAYLLFPLGFNAAGAGFGDYFPLLPWLFVFMGGSYFGVYVKEQACPAFVYKTRIKFLAAAGKHTIWIYMLHQPVAFFVFWLIFKERV